MNSRFVLFLLLIPAFLLTSCKQKTPLVEDEEAYRAEIEKWKQDRISRLKSERGWLNLAGLFWLEEGENSFGSDPANDILFPEKADPFCGSLQLDSGKVYLKVKEGVRIIMDGQEFAEGLLQDDHSKNTSYLEQGGLLWFIIKRGDKYGIRLRDLHHPRIEQLDHIPSYPVSLDYVVEAKLEPFDSVRTITVSTPVEGFTESYECPGTLHFRLNGQKLQVLPFTSGKGYFLVIADETSAVETYGAGRFMYVQPDSTGRILLDFNRAYNPPCAFSPFATCPMPPRENFLPTPIESGEKSVHFD